MNEVEQVDVSGGDGQVLADLNAMADEVQAQESAQQARADEAEKDQAEAQAAADAPGFELGAQMAVGFCVQMLKMRAPYVTIDADSQARVVEKLAPVMAKHGGGLPAWLLPYQEELELGMVLVGVAFGVAAQVKAHKVAEAVTEAEAETKLKAEKKGRETAVDGVSDALDEFGRPLPADLAA